MIIHLDFETRSVIDLKLAGAYKYAQDASTDVLCIAYSMNRGDIKLWTMGAAPPSELVEAAINPKAEFHAFNVGFERRIWHFVLHKRMGWPDVPLNRWYDTQADALAMGYPDQLGRCAIAMHLDYKKDAQGTKLINLLSKPIPNSEPPQFRQRADFPEYFLRLYEYCKQDVRVEMAVAEYLRVHTTRDGQERRIWMMTERMNDRGVPIDIVLANSFWTMIEDELKPTVLEELYDLTEGAVTSGSQIKKMNEALDSPKKNFQADELRKAVNCPLRSDRDKRIIEARLILGKSSTAKYTRMREGYCADGFVRDILQYHGAATGRFAGRGIQIQNFPRISPKNADEIAIDAVDPAMPLHEFEEKHGPVTNTAKMMLRPTIRAPRGYILVCRDYKSIEAIATAWTVKDEDQLDVFRAGKDIYIATAADMYGISYGDIDPEGEERQAGKIAVLACGYQGGWKALRDFAEGYQIFWTPKQSFKIVTDFRAARPKLVDAWYAFSDAAQAAIESGLPVEVVGTMPCTFKMQGPHLSMQLPNGKLLWFPEAEMRWSDIRYQTHEGEWKHITVYNVTHMWVEGDTGRWVRRSIHGGSLFQSYVQAVCRELMVEAMLQLEHRMSWPLHMTVHDEIVAMVEEKEAKHVQAFEDIMTEVPEWAKGMVIRADGWEGTRYRK